MQSRYKVVISNMLLYKEAELMPDMSRLTIGTGIHCDVRLRKDIFFEPIELVFTKDGESWTMICSDNLYLSVGDLRKLLTKNMVHGDVLEVKYQQSNLTAFSIEFLNDFDDGKRKYQRIIDISGQSVVTIGADRSRNIVLSSAYTGGEDVELRREGADYALYVRRTQYGVYHNGKKAAAREVIRNGDFISLSDFSFYLKDNFLFTHIRNDMWLNGLRSQDIQEKPSYPLFKRNTRIKSILNEEKIPILDPPENPEKPKNNLFMRLLPSLGMMLAAGVMAFMGSSMIIMSAISGVMAIVTAVINFKETNKDYNEAVATRLQQYTAYIAAKRDEIWKLREEERLALEKKYAALEVESANILNFSSRLFDRAKEDEDFLHIRIGTGAVEALREVDYKRQERLDTSDELQMIPEQVNQEFKFIARAPVTFDMKQISAVGIYGAEQNRYNLMKNMVIDIAARQFYSDVKMIFVAEEQNQSKIYWLRMLPHVCDDTLGVRGIASTDDSRNFIFEYLYKELSAREAGKQFDHRIVVFLYDSAGFNTHPISNFKDRAKDLGVTLVFFGEKRSDIPAGCGYLVELKGADSGTLIDTADDSRSKYFNYTSISDRDAERIVETLAPVYTEEVSLEGTLTKNYSMFEMLGIISVDDLDLQSRWASTQVFRSMAAPVGISKTGMVYLDLHDKAHGPHGLVAGTTGSGKSEILQTYILSMATLFAPTEVGFVIIDFKGGGMVNQFKELPHLMGAITNIDGKQINRSLKSIKAELQKRQRLFAEADVNHIDKYIKKYKAGEAEIPLPHLIIIVDEFAELKAEQPEFMKELISAARIGRSLGVHLILATQKPSGQVNEQIWSNSRFKLCLKVQSQQDSNEVLKSPLAAEIKEPGRAYLQVGNNEIFELFQSAYSGASEKAGDSSTREFSVYELSESGKRSPVFVQKRKSEEQAITQLDAIVQYVEEYCTEQNIQKLPDICLPPLAETIYFSTEHSQCADKGSIIADLGIFDDPENQYQGEYSINLTEQNLMIIGSAQTGKTNLLQNIIRSLSDKYTPKEVNIYIMDFASMVLKNFESLNHVGGVVTAYEDEKLKNLVKLLFTEIETRKSKLLSVGVSSFAAYKEAGQTDLPQIVVLIDNLTALKELYFQDDDTLLNLCREGLTVGITVVVANPQTSGIGYKYLSNFSGRIALFCNDSSEYVSLFEHCSERNDNIQGRCIVEIDKKHMDCQAYLAFRGEKEFERAQDIRSYVAAANKRYSGMMAKIIPVIPEVLSTGYVTSTLAGYMSGSSDLVMGLDYGTVTPLVLDFSTLGVLVVSGREKSGRHNFLRYCVHMLEQVHPGTSEVYIVDGIRKKLSNLRDCPNVAQYDFLAPSVTTIVKNVEQTLKQRYEALATGDENVLEKEKLIVLLLNSMDAMEALSADSGALNAYRNIIGKYKNMKVCVLLGGYENANVPYGAPEVVKKAKEARHFMFFDDLASMKIVDMPMAALRNFKKPIDLGDAYYIKENNCVKLKTVIDSTPTREK